MSRTSLTGPAINALFHSFTGTKKQAHNKPNKPFKSDKGNKTNNAENKFGKPKRKEFKGDKRKTFAKK